MALIERTVTDGTVQVREAIEIVDDATDEVKASRYHRYIISIENDSPDLSGLDAASQAVVQAARTPERRQAGQERRAARGLD